MHKISSKSGMRFGKLLVTSEFEVRRVGEKTACFWLCRCDCGVEKWVRGNSLKSLKSCGCSRNESISRHMKKRMRHFKDLNGRRFGRLVVLDGKKREKCGKSMVTKLLCRCDCGVEKWVQRSSLVSRTRPTKSCGCLQKENLSKARRLKPGQAASNRVYTQYRLRATRKGIDFLVTKEQFLEMSQQPCCYCGDVQGNAYEVDGTVFKYNGMDRQDNSRGYTRNNIVPCCGTCNIAKQSLTVDQFYGWVCKIYKKWVDHGDQEM